MNENYVDKVRKSLYRKSIKIINSKKKMSKNSRKIKFGKEKYDSVNVFSPATCTSKKYKEKKTVSRESPLIDDVFQETSKYEETFKSLKKNLKKLKDETHSISSDLLCPSTSEFPDVTLFKKQQNSNKSLLRIESNVSEDKFEFNVNDFFNTIKPSLNESFTEAHSGIENEFLKNKMNNVVIQSRRCVEEDNADSKRHVTPQDIPNNDERSNVDILEEYFDESVSEENLSLLCLQTPIEEVEHTISNETIKTTLSTNGEIKTQDQRQNRLIPLIETASDKSLGLSEEIKEKKKKSLFKLFDIGPQKLVVLKQNSLLPCFGLCSLKVLHGSIEILGYTLTKNSKEINIYSPRGSSLLVIKNITNTTEENDLEEIQHIFNNLKCLKNFKIEITSAIFICSKLENSKITFLEKYISQQIFPKVDVSRLTQLVFDPKDKFNITVPSPQWDKVLNSVKSSTKLFIAGGKGVGKSTFLRYSINRLLNRFQRVRVIDLDPGQSEFSIPGCISVVTLSEPIFGPSYTHLLTTDRSYLSNINVGQNPLRYLELIKFLFNSIDSVEGTPTLINYMGFATGIGLNIIASAITYVQPTDLVQIESVNHKKNFKTDLTVRTIWQNCELLGRNSKDVHFNFIKISSMTDDNTGWSLESRQVREMCVLSYFGEMMKNDIRSLSSHNLPMYDIGLKLIKITDTEGKEVPPTAINGNMVALCSKTSDLQIFNVLGYGIVRCIDYHAEKLVLITPVSADVLENVFYLMLSSVSLPPSVYMTQDYITGPIPYVMEGELEGLGQITKRSYIPANKK